MHDFELREMHSERCLSAFERYHRDYAEYVENHPRYCRNCGGYGIFTSSYDPSPAGVSLGAGSFTEVELCPECLEKGICPRCGFKSFEIDEDNGEYITPECPNCHFIPERSAGLPESPECFCWEEKDVQAQEEMYPWRKLLIS